MFVVDRSALAVILPLALLAAVVSWSNRSVETGVRPRAETESIQDGQGRDRSQTVAANLPSR